MPSLATDPLDVVIASLPSPPPKDVDLETTLVSAYSREHTFKWLTIAQPLITKIGILGRIVGKY